MPVNLNNTGSSGFQPPAGSNVSRMTVSEYNKQNQGTWTPDTKVAFSYGGKTYMLNDQQYNWVKSRWQSDNADTYGYDVEDQKRKAAGQMSSAVYNSYMGGIDDQLRDLGLPSIKKLDNYLEGYQKWHTGGMDQYFSQMNLPKNYWTNVKGWYQSDMQNAYENTAEDQQRKARGLMPSKWEAKYTDTEIDDQLRARGLPPISEFNTYRDRWNNYTGIENFYANVALNETNLRLAGVKDDDTKYPYNGDEYTGHDLYTMAFFDELDKKNDDGSYVYAPIRGMFKNGTKPTSSTSTGDYAYDRGAAITAANKEAANEGDYANYTAFSYDDYKSKYDDLYNRYFAGATLPSGQLVSDALAVKQMEEDEDATKMYYTIGKAATDAKAFVDKYMADHPDATPKQMFADMEKNNVSDKDAYKVYEAMKKVAKGQDWYDTVDGWSQTYGGVWSNVNESDAPIPDVAKPLTDEQRDAQLEEDLVKAAQQYGQAVVSGDEGKLAIANDRIKNLDYESNEALVETLKANKSPQFVQAVKDAITIYESAVAAYEDTYSGYGAPSEASREPINKANALLNALGFKGVHSAIEYVGGEKEAMSPGKYVAQKTAEMTAYVKAGKEKYANDTETIDATREAIESALIDDNGPKYSTIDGVIKVLDSIKNSSNPVAMQLALEDLGFTDGDFTGVADDLTYGWSEEDKRKLSYYLGGGKLSDRTYDDIIPGFNRAEGDTIGDTWADAGVAQDKQKLNTEDFSLALEWVLQQVNSGKMTEEDGYNLLAANGFQNEMEAYMPDEWHRAHFIENTAPGLWNQSREEDRLLWEEMTPEEQRAVSEDLWNGLTDEQKASMYRENWWEYDPSVYRTFGQALEQQFRAVLPGLAAELISTPVKVADAIGANISGRPDMWKTTEKLMQLQQGIGQLGAVTDNVNGAKVAQVASDVAQEILKMEVYGTIGGMAKGAFTTTKVGSAIASAAAAKGGSKVVKKAADMFLSMVGASPFVVSAFAGNYTEAKAFGASNSEATWYGMITGMTEGILEGFEFDELWGKAINGDKFAEQLLAGAQGFKRMGIVGKARVASMVVSGLGEFTEESIGYVVETALKLRHSDTWGKGTEWSTQDWLDQAMMGFLTGALGGGLHSIGSITADSLIKDYAMHDEATFRAVFPDLVEAVGRTENLPEATRRMYEKGGATVLSADALQEVNDQIKKCEDGIKNAPLAIKSIEDKAQEKIDSAYEEVRKYDAKLAKYADTSVYIPADEVGTVAELIDKRASAFRMAEAESKQIRSEADEQIQKANDALKGAQDQKAILEKKVQEHWAGVYFTNKAAIIDGLTDEIVTNLAQSYKSGMEYEPADLTGAAAEGAELIRKGVDNPVDAERPAMYNNITSQEVSTNGQSGEEAAPGGDARVSGQTVSVDNQGGQGRGELGRGNSRVLESVSVREKLNNMGYSVVEMNDSETQPFYDAIGEAKKANPYGAFVTQHETAEYDGMKKYLSADGGVGVAVTDDGNIVSVFKNPGVNTGKGAVSSILFTALENGGKKLDNFNSKKLSTLYLQHGFEPVARIAFNDDYAPDDWNYERDGRPDILFWVHNGDSADTILDKMGKYKMPDVDSLPLFEGDDAYDKAAAYRDTFVNENTGWTNQQKTNTRSLTDEEVAKVERAAKDAKFSGTLTFIDDQNAADGWIDSDGNITINRANISEADAKELSDNPGWWVLKHEFGHFAEGTPEYEAYSQAVQGILKAEFGENYDKVLDEIRNDYAQRGVTLDDAGVLRELVSKFSQSGRILNDAKTIETFVREQGSVADRIYNWIRYKIDDLKLRRKPNSALSREMLKAERLYAQAYRAANRKAPRSSQANANPSAAANQTGAQYSTGQSLEDLVKKYGAIEQGREPRARDVQVPKQTNDTNRVSQWIRSLVESGKLTDDQAQNVMRMVVEQDYGTYVPTSQAERMEEARAYIAERQPLQAQQEFHDMVMQGKFGVKTNALGLQLLSDASERGDFASVLDIAADLQLAATEAGQSAQIFNVLKELKGVGSAWYMQKVIDRMNSKYADRIKSGKMQKITVDQDLMANLAKATTVDQMAAAEEAVAKDVARQLPLTWDDRLSSWRYFSMLANPTTHIRNMTGNILMKGLNIAKDVVATGLENVLNVDQGDRAHAILTASDRSAWGNWAQQSYEEQARNLSGGGKLGFETFIKQNMRSFDTKWLNALAKFNFNALEGEDIAFIKPAYKTALMQYMKAQGYTLNEKGQAGKTNAKGEFVEMTKAQMNQAIDWASQQAWKATFRDASSLATMLNKLSKENAVSRLLVEGVMPFKKTPINIAKRGVEYSPAGIIMGIAQLTNGVNKGKVTTAQAIDNLASGITGTSLMALGVMLAKLGVIRAGGEKDKKLETYLEDTGDQTYAVKFGNKSINMSSIAPATIPLFMGVALNEMIEQGGDSLDLSTITDTIAGTLNPFMEMSFMSSLNSALKNYNANGIGGALGSTLLTAAQNYGSQYLPTLGGKIAQFLDPTQRTTKSDATSPVGGNLDYYGRSLLKKVPGLESTLQPDVNVWGQTNTKDSFGDWALDFANKFILPTNVKVTNRDAVDNELIRVVESTGVTDFLPSDGNKYFTVNKQKYTMNAKQYTEYSQERGQAAYAALKDTMASASYKQASDEDKAALLKKALDNAYKVVNNQWKEKLGAYDK